MIADRDDAGPFKEVFLLDMDGGGKPFPFGRVAICMRDGGWLGSSNGFPMSAPALYTRERAERIVDAWNKSLLEGSAR